MDSLDAILSYPNGTVNSTPSSSIPICRTIMNINTCSPLLFATLELLLYVTLCFSIIFRYRHHVLYYIYKDSSNIRSPQTPNEAIILIVLSVCLFIHGIVSTLGQQYAGSNCHDIFSTILFFLITILDWREEGQFQLYLQQYRSQSTITSDLNRPVDCEKSQADAVPVGEDSEEEIIEGKPAPTATNIHVQYQLRASIKALVAYAALVITQLDFSRADKTTPACTVFGIPISMAIGTVYLMRALILFIQGEKFKRGSGALRL